MEVEQQYQEQSQQQQVVTGAPIDEPPDCTIACDKGHITVHKLVLCEHSKYLQEILSKYPTAEHPIIILTELNIIDVRILVYFMYTGELVITNDASPTSLLRAAQILKIDSLTADDSTASNSNEYSSVPNDINDNEVDDVDDVDDDVDEIVVQRNNRDRERDIRNRDRRQQQQQQQQHHNHQHQQQNQRQHQQQQHHHQQQQQHHHQQQREQEDDVEDDDDNMIFQTERSSSSISHNNSINNSINDLELERAASRSDPLEINDTELEIQSRPDNIDKNNKIRCHLCNIGLSDVKCLYRHVLTRHLPEKWGYKCEFCDREFSRDDHLMRHYTTKHKNMEFDREKIRETRRLNREMAKNFHDQISTA